MARRFAELDWQRTPRGDISLRRRHDPTLDIEVYEVLLGDEYLMSSAFTAGEEALAHLALARVTADKIDVVVGGLGLGYTARAVLADPRVRRLHVVDALPQVIGWHERRLLPLADGLIDDPRCHLVHGDFFAGVDDAHGWGTEAPGLLHAIVVDIDHSPRHLLHPAHARFYTSAGLSAIAHRLHPGGVFALWSDDAPDDDFVAQLCDVFADADAHVVSFPNALTDGHSSNTVYVAGT